MQRIIKAEIYFDGENYCARCLGIDVFTQGKTLDEVVKNLREAVGLHLEEGLEGLEGEELKEKQKEGDLSEMTTIFAMMEIGVPDADVVTVT